MRKRHMASPHLMRRLQMAFLSSWMSSSSNEEVTHGDLIQSPLSNEEVTRGNLIQSPSSNEEVTHGDLIHNPSSKVLIQWGGDMWKPHPKSSSNEKVTCGDFIQSPSSNEEVPLVILIQSNDDSMWGGVFIHNFSSNEEATRGIWEGLHLMKVLSRGGFIWRWLKSVE